MRITYTPKEKELGKVTKVTATNHSENNMEFRVVRRIHEHGYSKTKLRWGWSDRLNREAWITVWHVSGFDIELLEFVKGENNE